MAGRLIRRHRLDTPADRRVIAALGALGPDAPTSVLPAPDARFRAELRTQLVAVTPRLVAEGDTVARPAAAAHAARPTSTRARATTPVPHRAPARTRPMTVLLSGATVVVLALGGATWLARGALPGDPLYGLKRTAESVDVSLSGSDLDKGHALLVGAQTRTEEVADLLDRPQAAAWGTGYSAAGVVNAATARRVVDALADADSDTRRGVDIVAADARSRGATEGLQLVVGWAAGQQQRIQALVDRLQGTGDAEAAAQRSLQEIVTANGEAAALLAQLQAPSAGTSTPTTTPVPGTGGGATPGGGTSSTSAPGSSVPSGSAPAPTTTDTSAPTATPTPALPRVTAPAAPSPGAIVTGSCGVQVSLPVASVSLGTCGPR